METSPPARTQVGLTIQPFAAIAWAEAEFLDRSEEAADKIGRGLNERTHTRRINAESVPMNVNVTKQKKLHKVISNILRDHGAVERGSK